ncbi:MAG: amino acid ABC transporter substrate-binding protein [Deltaproteobacteria bacterium]|nr:amino acid ABC transporter substrate-binding protein [Deltaproteobacteria bacterium]MBW2660136.1 amino acid ABC transporter substrate-binding protein [Deltaproteobacteria bacterium]
MTGFSSKESKKQFWLKIAAVILLLSGLSWLIFTESQLKRPGKLVVTTSGNVDMCISCHKDEKLDPAHDPAVIGCASCHLGNPLAITEEEGHKGMVLNPGDLRHVEKTCSVEGCHPTDVHKVKNSLMATNRGILGTLLYYWGESESQDSDLTVEQLLNSGETSLALDYFRKLCATCHLWKRKNDLPGVPEFFNQKGGGCSACHYSVPGKEDMATVAVGDEIEGEEPPAKKVHPLITAKIHTSNCVRCHNRSGRIGISYMGIFESEGYGTPYEKGGLNARQLPGARFYLEIADDVHHSKGMECIDCHTREEIMGDGTSYAHYEEQLEISCETCHSSTPGKTRKKNLLTNVAKEDSGWVLTGKVDDKKRPLKLPKKGVCDFSAHTRISCEACHSTWVAQCYGCHAKRDARQSHLDKLSLKETDGLWEEGRSYIRYEKPMLGVWDEKVVIVTPGCQDIVTVVDKEGEIEKSFNRFTMAAISPHTTQAKGRSCIDCHGSTKSIGLGEGTLFEQDGEMQFEPVDQGVETNSGRTVPFDGYVDIKGKALQKSSRPELRPFNGGELRSILRVGQCVGCHDSYSDVIWKNYTSDTVCARPLQQEVGGGK